LSYRNINTSKIEGIQFEDEKELFNFVGDVKKEIEEIKSLKNYISNFDILLADISDYENRVKLLEQSNNELEKIINCLNKEIYDFGKINDNIAVNIIVNNKSNIDTCKNIIIGYINQVNVLINIANKTDNVDIRKIIDSKIYEIAKSGNDVNNRIQAINRIKDDKLLEKIANESNKDIRINAVNHHHSYPFHDLQP